MREQPGSIWGPPLLAAVAVFAFYLAMANVVGIGGFAAPDGKLFFGPDSWMRAYRAIELLDHGHWFSDALLRVDGGIVEQHWTRPVDALNIAAALVLSPFFGGVRGGLEAWATVSGPLHFVAFTALLVWALRPMLNGPRAIALGCLLPLQFLLLGYFFPGRIDWHPQVFLGYALVIGCLVHLTVGGRRTSFPAMPVGLGIALCLWAGPESLVALAGGLPVLGLVWALEGERAFALTMRRLSGWLALGAVVAAVLEQGPQFAQPSYDEMSVLQAGLLVLHAIFWYAAARVSAAGMGRSVRFGTGAVFAAVAAGTLVALYPNLLSGRINPDVDKTYIRLRAMGILESQWIFKPAMLVEGGLTLLRDTFVDLGAIYVALVATPVLALVDKRRRFVWLAVMLTAAAVMMGKLEIARRHAPMLLILSLPVLVELIGQGVCRAFPASATKGDAQSGDRRQNLAVILAALLLVGTVLATEAMRLDGTSRKAANTVSMSPGTSQENAPPTVDAMDLMRRAAGVLADRPAGMVGTFADFGPELLYRTHHSVLSIPTHRDQPGFRGLHRAMSATDPEQARERLRQLGIDYLLVVDIPATSRFFGLDPDQGRTLGRRIMSGDLPGWTSRIEVDGLGAQSRLRLLQVSP